MCVSRTAESEISRPLLPAEQEAVAYLVFGSAEPSAIQHLTDSHRDRGRHFGLVMIWLSMSGPRFRKNWSLGPLESHHGTLWTARERIGLAVVRCLKQENLSATGALCG